MAISLNEITGYSIQREPLLAFILNELSDLIESDDVSLIISRWMQYCIHKNKQISFSQDGIQNDGVFQSINEFGQAIIKCNDKSVTYDGVINIL